MQGLGITPAVLVAIQFRLGFQASAIRRAHKVDPIGRIIGQGGGCRNIVGTLGGIALVHELTVLYRTHRITDSGRCGSDTCPDAIRDGIVLGNIFQVRIGSRTRKQVERRVLSHDFDQDRRLCISIRLEYRR